MSPLPRYFRRCFCHDATPFAFSPRYFAAFSPYAAAIYFSAIAADVVATYDAAAATRHAVTPPYDTATPPLMFQHYAAYVIC